MPPDMKRFIEAGKTALKEGQRAVSYILEERAKEGPQGESAVFAMSDVILLPPQPRPNSPRDFILFEGHFRRACDEDGLTPDEFIGFGPCVKFQKSCEAGYLATVEEIKARRRLESLQA